AGNFLLYGIAGVISLTSAAFKGSIAICYPQETFLSLMSHMLGETYTAITNDLEDGAAELLNITFGQAKAVLNEKGYKIDKAIPTVVRGRELRVRHVASQPTMIVPFESSSGPLHIEISLEAQNIAR
ncbi:MAG: chemotaxis protein CheX, partial [Bdellovibrionales bacterium]|nr:chemotaxis protein CheX [Bdellovibrionales bacterium]